MIDVSSVLRKTDALNEHRAMISPSDFERICAAAALSREALFAKPISARHIDVSFATSVLTVAAAYAGLAIQLWKVMREEGDRANAEDLKTRTDADFPDVERPEPVVRIQICVEVVARCESRRR